MEAKRPLAAIAIASTLIITALAVLAPTAQANHGCSFGVGLDTSHAPADTWTTHSHPHWTFDNAHCRVYAWGVQPSWGGYFETGAGGFHPDLPSGIYSVSVRAYHSVDHWHSQGFNHCHRTIFGVCIDWHWHDTSFNHEHFGYTGFVGGPQVKIDITLPEVDVSGITGPYVDDLYVTSATAISLSASDAHSGLAAVETAQDEGAWTAFEESAHVTGEDGLHTFGFRAIDNVDWITAKTRDFILDNTPPAITIIHPTPNSLNVDAMSAETCMGNARITNGGETVFEAPDAPPAPGLPPEVQQALDDAVAGAVDAPLPGVPEEVSSALPPEAAAAVEEASAGLPGDVPDEEAPTAPAVVDEGPDACAGHVLSTLGQDVPAPAAPDAPAVPQDPETPELPVGVPETPETPELPDAPIGPGDVLPPTLAGMVEDAIAQIPTEAPTPEEPTLPAIGEPRDELESAIGPIPVEDPETPESLVVEAASFDFANPVVLTGIVEMSANVDDATVGTDLVEFIVDGEVRSAQSAGNGDYAWSWDTTAEAAGEHSFSIRAVDRLGNEDAVEFTVIVLATTQEGLENTAAVTQADAEADLAQAQADATATAEETQADAEAAPGEIQAAAEAAPGEAQTAAAAAQADAESRAATAQGYAQGRAEEIVPDEAEGAVDDAISQLPPV